MQIGEPMMADLIAEVSLRLVVGHGLPLFVCDMCVISVCPPFCIDVDTLCLGSVFGLDISRRILARVCLPLET